MRSSIACSRCRRSKIKCVNAGIDTTCRACEASGRECVYPAPATGGGAAKRDIAATLDGDDRNAADWDNPKRQRSRKVVGGAAGSAGKDGGKGLVDVLDSSILSPKVWEALSKSFQTQFATILPFIDSTTLKNQAGQLSASQADAHSEHNPQSPPPRSQLSPLILLGVLALTARFHPQLVAYHSPASASNPSNPSAASEFYASALRARLTVPDGLGLVSPDLVHVQVLLMLALHEWGMCRGKSAWLYVGIAIRLAQAMGLSYELENDPFAAASSSAREASRYAALKMEADHFGMVQRQKEQPEQSSDDVIVQETKRRTFWACFIMDRCLSSGKHRPRMVKVRDLDIQLPSDDAFAFGERVRTSKLSDSPARRASSFDGPGVQIPSLRQSVPYGEDSLRNGSTDSKGWSPVAKRMDSVVDHDIDRWEVGAQESLLSRVIRIIRIWGSISKWACAGGRRNETYGPWQPESSFARLRVKLAEFQENLPRKLQYSQRSTDGHSQNEHSLSAYMVMHVVYFLSLIVLHRAYLPFLPLRCNEPVGPLDEPSFPREQYAVPDGFWRDSTRELFRAARNMMDLVIACQERGVLVETPLVGFAIYNAAFIGLYAAHFNHMDVDGYLSVRQQLLSPSSTGSGIMQPQLPTRKSLDILRDMRPRLGLATGWFRTLNRLHSYFVKVKKDFKSRSRSTDSLDGPMGLRPVREIGPVGGLEEFKLFEKVFLEFGNIDDQIPEAATGSGPMDEDVPNTIIALSERGGGGLALSDTASNAAVKSESGDSAMDGQKRGDPWVSVNSSKNLPPPPPLTPSASEGDLPRSEMDRRPSLPLPSRPLPPTQQPSSSSPYAFPSIQQHHNNSMSSSTASPSLPSLTAAVSTTQQPPPTSSQYAGTPTNRLQPINSWHHHQQQGPPPPPYSQSLPPINATTTATTAPHPSYAPPPPMLPLPGSVPYAPTPTSMITDYSSYPALWSTSLGGDDVIAFLADGSFELGRSTSCSEVGFSTGWLSAVWNDLG